MDKVARDDIAAAAAVHKELGPEFDSAVAESLVERIGTEIDKRVDARLSTQGGTVSRRPEGGQPSIRQNTWRPVALALGSMGLGIGATAAVLNAGATVTSSAVSLPVSSGQVFLCVLIWLVIGVINVVYNRRT